MLSKNSKYIAIVVLTCFTSAQLLAQVKTATAAKRPAASTAKKTTNTYRIVLLPDFYQYKPIKKGDTTYSYECYDHEMKKMNVDTIRNIKSVKDIFYFKSYFQGPYTPGSIVSPPYLSNKLYVYERADDNSWLGINGLTKEQMQYKELKNKIMKTDTVLVTDRLTGAKANVIHKYYKTERSSAEGVPHKHTH